MLDDFCEMMAGIGMLLVELAASAVCWVCDNWNELSKPLWKR